jgi:hypothetical protein
VSAIIRHALFSRFNRPDSPCHFVPRFKIRSLVHHIQAFTLSGIKWIFGFKQLQIIVSGCVDVLLATSPFQENLFRLRFSSLLCWLGATLKKTVSSRNPNCQLAENS